MNCPDRFPSIYQAYNGIFKKEIKEETWTTSKAKFLEYASEFNKNRKEES